MDSQMSLSQLACCHKLDKHAPSTLVPYSYARAMRSHKYEHSSWMFKLIKTEAKSPKLPSLVGHSSSNFSMMATSI
eukprot:c5930_g2_i1 orf=1-228(-)